MTKITFLGDIMCKKELLSVYKKNNQFDFDDIFCEIKNYIKTSDYTIGNLETPITKNINELTNEKFSFASPYEFAKAVYDCGIEYVSTANNHCLDRGIDGIYDTIECLDQIGLKHTGTFKTKDNLNCIEVNGIKLGILSYTYGTNAFSNNYYLKGDKKDCVNQFQNQELSNILIRYAFKHNNIFAKVIKKIDKLYNNVPIYERKENSLIKMYKLKKNIRKLKNKNVDLIIMCMHMGGQYNDKPSKRTKKLVKKLKKYGVNIICGNHEHVVHDGEFNNIDENFIATYSLGNFDGIAGVYDSPFDKKSEYSIAWNVYIDKNEINTRIIKSSFSVLKTISTKEKGIKTVELYKLIKNENNLKKREQLIKDMKIIAQRFCKKEINTIEKEYII